MRRDQRGPTGVEMDAAVAEHAKAWPVRFAKVRHEVATWLTGSPNPRAIEPIERPPSWIMIIEAGEVAGMLRSESAGWRLERSSCSQ